MPHIESRSPQDVILSRLSAGVSTRANKVQQVEEVGSLLRKYELHTTSPEGGVILHGVFGIAGPISHLHAARVALAAVLAYRLRRHALADDDDDDVEVASEESVIPPVTGHASTADDALGQVHEEIRALLNKHNAKLSVVNSEIHIAVSRRVN